LGEKGDRSLRSKTMAAKQINMSTIKQLLLLHNQQKGKKEIARLLGISKNTVKKYLTTFSSLNHPIKDLLLKDAEALALLLNGEERQDESVRYKNLIEDIDYFKTELRRHNVTRKLLWIEYRKRHSGGYEYAQFCHHLRQNIKSTQVSMVINHDPGEQLYIDFAGKTWPVYDQEFGNGYSKKQLFIANLGYSQYGYVEAVATQKVEDFIAALRRCLEYFGGSPKSIIPDNLKSAVIKTDRYEPSLNKVLEDFGNHYSTTIIPARSAKPKDKALVENMVKHVYAGIWGPVRDRKYFTLSELNDAIKEGLEEYNSKKFQRKEDSRLSLFESDEKQLLIPLPDTKFELKKYRQLQVQKNSHIYLNEDKHYYSIPYAYIGKKTKVIYTNSLVSIYYKFVQVAVHQRNRKPHYYTTLQEHLPSHFNDYKDRSPDYYKKWAQNQSVATQEIIDKIFSSRLHPEQAYRTCDGIKHLAKKIDKNVFAKACQIAVAYQSYSYTFIKSLIENGMTNQELPDTDLCNNETKIGNVQDHENMRGSKYYQNQIL
jgi:transposase